MSNDRLAELIAISALTPLDRGTRNFRPLTTQCVTAKQHSSACRRSAGRIRPRRVVGFGDEERATRVLSFAMRRCRPPVAMQVSADADLIECSMATKRYRQHRRSGDATAQAITTPPRNAPHCIEHCRVFTVCRPLDDATMLSRRFSATKSWPSKLPSRWTILSTRRLFQRDRSLRQYTQVAVTGRSGDLVEAKTDKPPPGKQHCWRELRMPFARYPASMSATRYRGRYDRHGSPAGSGCAGMAARHGADTNAYKEGEANPLAGMLSINVPPIGDRCVTSRRESLSATVRRPSPGSDNASRSRDIRITLDAFRLVAIAGSLVVAVVKELRRGQHRRRAGGVTPLSCSSLLTSYRYLVAFDRLFPTTFMRIRSSDSAERPRAYSISASPIERDKQMVKGSGAPEGVNVLNQTPASGSGIRRDHAHAGTKVECAENGDLHQARNWRRQSPSSTARPCHFQVLTLTLWQLRCRSRAVGHSNPGTPPAHRRRDDAGESRRQM